MVQKKKFKNCPEPEHELLVVNNNGIQAIFREDIQEINTGNRSEYLAYEYIMPIDDTFGIIEWFNTNKDNLREQAIQSDYNKQVNLVNATCRVLFDEAKQVEDLYGLSDEWDNYIAELAMIPYQKGYPYYIKWPDKPSMPE